MISFHVVCFCAFFHRVEVSQEDLCSTFNVIGRTSWDLVQVFRLDGSSVADAQKRKTPEIEALAEEICFPEGEFNSLFFCWNGWNPLVKQKRGEQPVLRMNPRVPCVSSFDVFVCIVDRFGSFCRKKGADPHAGVFLSFPVSVLFFFFLCEVRWRRR